MAQEYKLILKHADEPGYTPDIECYLRHGGYDALKKALAIQPKDLAGRQKTFRPGANPRGRESFRPARSRRRGFFLRPQVELRGPQKRQADLPDLQRRRIRAGHVQGSPDHPQGSAPAHRGHDHLVLRERCEARLHLHPRRNARRREDFEPRAEGSPREKFPRQKHSRHAATIWRFTFIAARALTSAAKKPA